MSIKREFPKNDDYKHIVTYTTQRFENEKGEQVSINITAGQIVSFKYDPIVKKTKVLIDGTFTGIYAVNSKD